MWTLKTILGCSSYLGGDLRNTYCYLNCSIGIGNVNILFKLKSAIPEPQVQHVLHVHVLPFLAAVCATKRTSSKQTYYSCYKPIN
jgi:hypothetical protein